MKKIIVVIVSLVCFFVSACSSTPNEIETNKNGVAVQQEESLNGTEDYEALKQSMGDSQIWSCKNDKLTLVVDAMVEMPDTAPTVGTLESEALSEDEIRGVFAEEDSTNRYYNFWQYGFETDIEESSENQKEFPADTESVNEEEWTETQEQYVHKVCGEVTFLCEKLSLLYQPENLILETDSMGTEYVRGTLRLCLENICFCDLNSIASVENMPEVSGEISATDTLVGRFAISENYHVANSEEAVLVKWSDIVEKVYDMTKNGTLHFDLPVLKITRIELQYLLNDDMTYVPVWCFYGNEEEALLPDVPAFVINACDGRVEYSM